MRSNLQPLKDLRSEFPIEVVQLDDGYQAALGDWDRTNAKFPSGSEKARKRNSRRRFHRGNLDRAFFAARDSLLMREHGDWFIKHRETGEPLRAGYNPNWTTSDDKYAYALDPSHPEFAAHLERLFRKIVEDFGYDYLKLDFLYAAAAEGIRHDPTMTRAETLRRGLEAIRRGAGERTFILGCGCPLGTGGRHRRRNAHRTRCRAVLGRHHRSDWRAGHRARDRCDPRAQLHASAPVAQRSRLPDAAREGDPRLPTTNARRWQGRSSPPAGCS